MNTFNIHNNPTEEMEVFFEPTPSQIFYNSDSELSEEAEIYINHLEQKLKAKNLAIETLRKEMDGRENNYVVNQLWKIQYL